jgi:predicted O-methyltransferase YrrM
VLDGLALVGEKQRAWRFADAGFIGSGQMLNMRITKKDCALILCVSVLMVVVLVVASSISREAVLIMLPVATAIPILAVLLEIYRRVNETFLARYDKEDRDSRQHYSQIESLLSLFFTLKPTLPLPDMRGWAVSPDLLKKVTELIFAEKPDLVVEASSGVSTLIIAYCLKQLGQGKVISLEHDAKYAAISQRLISFHNLQDIATIVHAPLKEHQIEGHKWLWYDTDRLSIDQPIDFFLVDGPPGNIQELSRYPALPLLYGHLRDGASIVLDDGNRKDERAIVIRWEKEFSHITSEFLTTETGAFLIRKDKIILSSSDSGIAK